jgi:hypothetical protein
MLAFRNCLSNNVGADFSRDVDSLGVNNQCFPSIP